MKPTEKKAKELIEKFATEIGSSDFHIPEFITGVPMADGSKEYTKILDEETESLAKINAILCCKEILNLQSVKGGSWLPTKVPDSIKFWESVIKEIENME